VLSANRQRRLPNESERGGGPRVGVARVAHHGEAEDDAEHEKQKCCYDRFSHHQEYSKETCHATYPVLYSLDQRRWP
jgi:hypothetical protein